MSGLPQTSKMESFTTIVNDSLMKKKKSFFWKMKEFSFEPYFELVESYFEPQNVIMQTILYFG